MSEIHNPRVIGDLLLSRKPTDPSHAVRLQDLDARVQALRAFVTDIAPVNAGGIVASKVYAATVPANKVLQSAIADTKNLRVTVLAQGSLFEVPEVKVNDVKVTNFTSVSDSLFSGTVDITMNATGDITVAVTGGQTTKTRVVIATEGPVVQNAIIGTLPNNQTEGKAGDVVSISGAVANETVSMAVLDAAAASGGTINTFGAADSAGTGFKTFSGTITVSSRTGAQTAQVQATNQLGTKGAAISTANSITLNQTAPVIGAITVNYPNGQGALKNGDTATVSSTITGADSVQYVFGASGQDVTITDPTTYAVSKSAKLNSGTYNVANNYTITAVKASNGAQATRQGSVRIANTAPTATVSILNNPARLRTSAAGELYTLRVQPNQLLSANPEATLSAGEFTGDWTFSGGVYSRQFKVTDAMARGNQTAQVTLSNLAAVAGTGSLNYAIGGLTERTITFPPFARYAPIGATVSDITKTRARYNGQSVDLARRTDLSDVAASFSIVDANGIYNPNGTHLYLNDSAFAGANTSGTLQVLFEETV